MFYFTAGAFSGEQKKWGIPEETPLHNYRELRSFFSTLATSIRLPVRSLQNWDVLTEWVFLQAVKTVSTEEKRGEGG